MGSPSSKKRKPKVGLRVYTKAVVASGFRSSCVDAADPVPGFASGCPSAIVVYGPPLAVGLVSVRSVLGSARVDARLKHSSRTADTTPDENFPPAGMTQAPLVDMMFPGAGMYPSSLGAYPSSSLKDAPAPSPINLNPKNPAWR